MRLLTLVKAAIRVRRIMKRRMQAPEGGVADDDGPQMRRNDDREGDERSELAGEAAAQREGGSGTQRGDDMAHAIDVKQIHLNRRLVAAS
jgi:hypothetical protein